MGLTRLVYRTRAQQMADASGSQRWDSTAGAAGEIDQFLGDEFDRSWRRILNASPFYRVAQRTATSDATGRYAIADLTNTTTANAQQRLYRVLRVAINNITYQFQPRSEQEFLAASLGLYRGYYWYLEGLFLTAMPISASTVATGIWVNYIPTRIDNLSADTITVDYPDGYERIISLRTAAAMLNKGGAEAEGARYLIAQADQLEAEMLQDLARVSIEPTRIAYPDSAADWGSSLY
ncbi:MAG: hypothetical protein ACR652_24330 [Methylocystis sp.]|uniref:hypothetical protein n=1 Tax=Methylocystis sp. TaxID=1911079 RepID=UPI003DA36D58